MFTTFWKSKKNAHIRKFYEYVLERKRALDDTDILDKPALTCVVVL
jgi:hypothetical protein